MALKAALQLLLECRLWIIAFWVKSKDLSDANVLWNLLYGGWVASPVPIFGILALLTFWVKFKDLSDANVVLSCNGVWWVGILAQFTEITQICGLCC